MRLAGRVTASHGRSRRDPAGGVPVTALQLELEHDLTPDSETLRPGRPGSCSSPGPLNSVEPPQSKLERALLRLRGLPPRLGNGRPGAACRDGCPGPAWSAACQWPAGGGPRPGRSGHEFRRFRAESLFVNLTFNLKVIATD